MAPCFRLYAPGKAFLDLTRMRTECQKKIADTPMILKKMEIDMPGADRGLCAEDPTLAEFLMRAHGVDGT